MLLQIWEPIEERNFYVHTLIYIYASCTQKLSSLGSHTSLEHLFDNAKGTVNPETNELSWQLTRHRNYTFLMPINIHSNILIFQWKAFGNKNIFNFKQTSKQFSRVVKWHLNVKWHSQWSTRKFHCLQNFLTVRRIRKSTICIKFLLIKMNWTEVSCVTFRHRHEAFFKNK